MRRASRKQNLLILGASGGVGQALLIYLSSHRESFNRIILLDKNKRFLANKFINHTKLNYLFLHQEITLPHDETKYHALLREHDIHIVLDVTDDETLPLFHATDKAGVSYVNSSINGPAMTHEHVLAVWGARSQFNHAPHILSTGMNPGIVNMWARHGIAKFGVPDEITVFEYDTSQTGASDHPMVTWSVKKFLEEVSEEPSVVMAGRDQPRKFLPNAIENRICMKKILSPILALKEYPEGFIVPHDEIVSLAQKYNVPAHFVYAINIGTMKKMIAAYQERHRLFLGDLLLGDNLGETLDGADSIGVLLEYHDKKVYYFNAIANVSVRGTNATYTQVVTGIIAALLTLAHDTIPSGAHFVEDLEDSYFERYIFDRMQVQEYVFDKDAGRLSAVQNTLPIAVPSCTSNVFVNCGAKKKYRKMRASNRIATTRIRVSRTE